MTSRAAIRGIDRSAPIVVGGGGGSGTRVVALLLLRMGFFLGEDRNTAEDNLLFTLLFKRPSWYARADRATIDRAIAVLERGLLDGCGSSDFSMLSVAAKDMVLHNRDYALPRRVLWAARRVRAAMRRPKLDGRAPGWGWKEPNSHVYIEHLVRRFPAMRYIHVIRHGLDMAFSANQAQLRNWGPIFGLEEEQHEAPAQRALRFWIRSNQSAIRKAEQALGDRFLLVRFDDLCARPREEIDRLADFLEVSLAEDAMEMLSTIPQSPASRGRYRDRHVSIFDEGSLDAVEALGFPIEGRRQGVAA